MFEEEEKVLLISARCFCKYQEWCSCKCDEERENY
jgi:hypothetical protein